MSDPLGPKGPRFLRVNGDHVGHIWYSPSQPGWFGALFSWGEKATPVGPYRTKRQAMTAIEKAHKSDPAAHPETEGPP